MCVCVCVCVCVFPQWQFSDSEEEVRYRAHLAVEMCARTREGQVDFHLHTLASLLE